MLMLILLIILEPAGIAGVLPLEPPRNGIVYSAEFRGRGAESFKVGLGRI
jgi:hypothetical protein